MRKIAAAKDADAEKKTAKAAGKRTQAREERLPFSSVDGPLADEQPETSYGNHAGKQRPQEDAAIVVVCDLQEP